jgi:hypothetical protein
MTIGALVAKISRGRAVQSCIVLPASEVLQVWINILHYKWKGLAGKVNKVTMKFDGLVKSRVL